LRLPDIWSTSKGQGIFPSIWCLFPVLTAVLWILISTLVRVIRAPH
jgi:hypothetical protein